MGHEGLPILGAGRGKRLFVSRRSLGDVGVVVDEPTKQIHAIVGVFGRIEDMGVPEIIHVLRPGNDVVRRRSRQIEELTIMAFYFVEEVLLRFGRKPPHDSPPKGFPLQVLLADLLEIQTQHLVPNFFV